MADKGINFDFLDDDTLPMGRRAGEREDMLSQTDMSQISFDSQTFAAAVHGMSQWDLLLKIAEERRTTSDVSLSASIDAYSSSLRQFSIQDKQEMETKQEDLNLQIASLQERLKRRNVLIGTIRNSYLKDVVELKNVMFGVLTETERLRVVSQWEATIPSLDLRKPIELCAPAEAEFTHTPCDTCGGQVEIFHRQSSRFVKLQDSLKEYKRKQEQLLSANTVQKSIIDTNTMTAREVEKVHTEEKKFMYNELKHVKQQVEELEKEVSTLRIKNRRLLGENTVLKEDNKDFIVVKDELRMAERELVKQKTNNDILTERVAKHENKIADLEQEADMNRQESIEVLKRFNDEKEVTIQLRGDLRATNESLSLWKNKHAHVSEELRVSQEDGTRLKEIAAGIRDELEGVRKLMDSEISRHVGISRELRGELSVARSEIELLVENLRVESWLLEGSRMMNEEYPPRVITLQGTVADLEEDLDDKDEEIEELRAYIRQIAAGPSSRPGSRAAGGEDREQRKDGELSQREASMVKALKQVLLNDLSN